METKKLSRLLSNNFLRLMVISVVVSIIASVISGVVFGLLIKPVYKSSVSLIIYTSESDRLKNYSDVMMSQQLVKTYCEYAKSIAVAEDVIQSLDLKMSVEQLHSMISVAPKANTQFLIISVKSKDPAEALSIANQLSLSLKKVSTEIMQYDLVKILDKAQYPLSPDGPRLSYIVIMTFFICLTALIGILCLVKYLDEPIPSTKEQEINNQ